MKPLAALLCSLALIMAALAQTPPAPPPARKASGEKAPPAKAAKKEEPPPKIEGMEIPRGDRGFLGLEVVNSVFKLSFYDAKRKPVPPDVVRAVLRWDPKNKVGKERVVLSPGGKNTMTSEKVVRPPYNFKLFITLLKEASEGDDPVGETHVVDFRQ